MRALTWFLLTAVLTGCSSDEIAGFTSDRNEVASSNQADHSGPELHDSVIRAGYGIPSCHIEMSVDELDSEWRIPSDSALAEEFLCNKHAGIDVKHQDGRISAIFFYYRSKESDLYYGKTEKSVSTGNSLNQIREKYGDPSYIGKSVQSDLGEFPGETEMMSNMWKKGLDFS
jgi:hypothetical protein